MMKIKKFGDLYFFHPKSKIQASEGKKIGKFPLYTSSSNLKWRIDISGFNTQALIFGTGGSASIHYVTGQFNVSTDCLVTSSKQQEVNVKYAYYYLLYNIHILERGFKGAGLKHISRKYIEGIDIKYPDIEIQNKIVAILDKVNNIIEKREKALSLFEKLLKALFADKFLKTEGVNVLNLDEVAHVTSGLTKGKKYAGKVTHMYPYMRVANVQDGFLDLSEVKEIEATEEEADRYKLEEDDLLLTEGGDPDQLGRGALWKNQINNCIHQNHIFKVRAKDRDVINPTFLSYQLSSQYGKFYFLKAAKQTSGIASINSTQLKAFPVYIPPIDEQNRFEQTVTKVERSKATLVQSVSVIKNLLDSISQLAFNGLLTFNVSVMLEVFLNEINLEKNDAENDITAAKNDSTLLRMLINRLNNQEFETEKLYNKGKYVVFRILKEEGDMIKQKFNSVNQQIELTV